MLTLEDIVKGVDLELKIKNRNLIDPNSGVIIAADISSFLERLQGIYICRFGGWPIAWRVDPNDMTRYQYEYYFGVGITEESPCYRVGFAAGDNPVALVEAYEIEVGPKVFRDSEDFDSFEKGGLIGVYNESS